MSPRSLRTKDFLLHMLQAVDRAQDYTKGKTEAEFLSDLLLQDAVIRNIEILGEASKNILRALPDASSKFPNIPFAVMYATRNHLSHGDFSVNALRLWEVVRHELPNLRRELESVIQHFDTEPR